MNSQDGQLHSAGDSEWRSPVESAIRTTMPRIVKIATGVKLFCDSADGFGGQHIPVGHLSLGSVIYRVSQYHDVVRIHSDVRDGEKQGADVSISSLVLMAQKAICQRVRPNQPERLLIRQGLSHASAAKRN
jgi:hypothetical protein